MNNLSVQEAVVATEDFKVADISLADFGRKEITLAEAEMPALMSLRAKYEKDQPLAGAKILSSRPHPKRLDILHFRCWLPLSSLVEGRAEVQAA